MSPCVQSEKTPKLKLQKIDRWASTSYLASSLLFVAPLKSLQLIVNTRWGLFGWTKAKYLMSWLQAVLAVPKYLKSFCTHTEADFGDSVPNYTNEPTTSAEQTIMMMWYFLYRQHTASILICMQNQCYNKYSGQIPQELCVLCRFPPHLFPMFLSVKLSALVPYKGKRPSCFFPPQHSTFRPSINDSINVS